MIKKRMQLTLFVDRDHSLALEAIRKEFNPLQFELIESHVTLCREDELEQLEKIIHNLTSLSFGNLTVHFGPVARFSDGRGVLLPAAGSNDQFYKLREAILQDIIPNPRKHEPHITLMHPRNSVCTDQSFQQIQQRKLPAELIFKKISLIEQAGENNWRVLREFPLNKSLTPR